MMKKTWGKRVKDSQLWFYRDLLKKNNAFISTRKQKKKNDTEQTILDFKSKINYKIIIANFEQLDVTLNIHRTCEILWQIEIITKSYFESIINELAIKYMLHCEMFKARTRSNLFPSLWVCAFSKRLSNGRDAWPKRLDFRLAYPRSTRNSL